MALVKVIQFQHKSAVAPNATNMAIELRNAAQVIRTKGLLDGTLTQTQGKWAIGVAIGDTATQTLIWEGL